MTSDQANLKFLRYDSISTNMKEKPNKTATSKFKTSPLPITALPRAT